MKDVLQKKLKEIVSSLSDKEIEVVLSLPSNSDNGDFTTNLALRMGGLRPSEASGEGGNPMENAEKIKIALEKDLPDSIEKVEVAKPGFVNFFLSKDYLIKNLSLVNEEYGKGEVLQGKKVMVEYTDPNPFKEFHIGHLYSNTVGEALSRLIESQGAEVWRVNYQGDVGLHVAKSIWGMRKIKDEIPNDEASLSEKVAFLGKAYAKGATAYEEDEDAKKEITELNKRIYENDPEIMDLYNRGKKWSLDYFEQIYKKLGTSFKKLYFESDAGKVGLELVHENLKRGIFKEDEGAVIFPGKNYGLHNRVFINSLGLPTYEAKELGLAPTKYKDFPYDLSIIITGNEINEYFKVLIKALALTNPSLGEKTKHISHGMVRLPGGKMSSRTGDVITGEWLIDETERRLSETYPAMEKDTRGKVAVAAIKYALLKSGIGHDIEFNLDESVSFDGNSGPYIQYTYARIQSILRKAKGAENVNAEKLEVEEKELLRYLVQYPEVVALAAQGYSPNLIANYLFNLSQKFNLFYQKHQVVGSINEGFRVTLIAGVGQVIKNGLNLLGIETVEKM